MSINQDAEKNDIHMLKNIDYLGRGYNILTIDPYTFSSGGASKHYVFDINAFNNTKPIPDGTALIPNGTEYHSQDQSISSTQTDYLYSDYDFQSTFRNEVATSVGIFGLFSFSSSQTYKKYKQEVGSSEQLSTYTKVELKDYSVEIVNGDHEEQLPLSHLFAKEVANLPAEYDDIKYEAIIETYGTHYAKNVVFGGRASQSIVMSKNTYSTLTREGIDISLGAQGAFKGVTGDVSGGLSKEEQAAFNSETRSGQSSILYIGGHPNEDLNEFMKSVTSNPAPIGLFLASLDELFTDYYFPNDPHIVQKQKSMQQAIYNYLETNGEINERFSSNEWLLFDEHGINFDTGDYPCVAVFDDGCVVDIHNGGGNNNLYYRIGFINNNLVNWVGKHGTQYDTGNHPSIAALSDRHLVEIHNGGGNNNLYYRIGKVKNNIISWIGNNGVKYDTGDEPSVARINDETIVEVHNGGGNNNLYYRIGKVTSDAIYWVGDHGNKFGTGKQPSVTVLNEKTVVVTNNDGGNLYYSVATFENDQLTWDKSQFGVKYGTGNYPMIASVGENTLLQINNGGSNNLYYLVGKVIDGRLTWVGTKGIKFDTGDRPTLAIMPNGNTVEMHNGGGNNNLYYHLGKLE